MNNRIAKKIRLIDLSAGAVLLAVIAGTVVVGVLPLYAGMQRNNQQAQALRQDLSKLDGLSVTLTQVEAELTGTEARLAESEARLPSTNAMDQFVAEIAKIAEHSGLEIDAMQPKPLKDGPSYRVAPVEISGTGSFEACYQFLTGLKQMNRLTRIDDLVIQIESTANRQDSAASPLCRVSVGISTFIAR